MVLLALVLAVASMALVALASSPANATRPRVERASVTGVARGLAPGLAGKSGVLRVMIFLTDNSLLKATQQERKKLTAPLAGVTAARRFAIRSPKREMPAERVIAGRMDDLRNVALLNLRRAATSGTLQSERVAHVITQSGGRVIDAAALPNSITATIPASRLTRIAVLPGVYAVRDAPQPIWASSPIDGSETWHSNGFTGAGLSSDGLGGPDYVAFDQGVRVSHQAFRTRLPGDPVNSGLGTGASRIISPSGRTNFGGSQHANVVASEVGATDLNQYATSGSPYPPTWQNQKGLAYGVDKLYDPYQAQSGDRWLLGLVYNGEPGVTDIPEVVNYSAGIYEDTIDSNIDWAGIDAEVSQYGITQTISAGNCGINPSIYTGCNGSPGDSIHRVSTPGTDYNTITVGGWSGTDPYDPSTWSVWPNSSPGPTYGGRKKPDLVATPNAAAGGPVSFNDTGYNNPGQGTSFAAPQVAAGAILLASSGVYQPTAQKAILINSATPVGTQTYWSPLTGWGAMNLDGAFTARGYYQSSSVTAAGANGVRFFKQLGVVSGDRTTLVWNRRASSFNALSTPTSQTLTNLDLFQIDPSSGTTTATGGVDANDTVDTNPTVDAANPMPGNGSDGEDNVEQVRSTASGTQIYKVKAQSTIDGAGSEPFSIAGSRAVTALQTPIPTVSLTPSSAIVGPGQSVTITAQITNPSADLALSSTNITLGALPAGVSLTSGAVTQSVGALAASGTSTKTWTVAGTADGIASLSATVSGTTYSEPFSGSGTTNFTVDANPPTVTITPAGAWSATTTPAFSWSATDALSSVDHYDVEVARNGGAYVPLLTSTTATTANVAGGEGEQLHLRVRAADSFGNVSDWTEQSVTVDAVGPSVTIGNAIQAADGTITADVTANNAGSPVTASYVFGITGSRSVNSGAVTGPTVRYTFARQRATTYPVLTVTAFDGLGRAATATRTFTVAGSVRSANLIITSAISRRGYLAITGRLDRAAKGSVRVTVRRVGRAGTRRAKKTLQIRSGRFRGRLRLAPGRYRVTVRFAGSGGVAAAATGRAARVR